MNKLNKVLLTILLLPLMIVNVFAASVPYQWIVGGETVNTNANQAGTARLEKDGKIVTLFLNNYNGGKLELECYGTGQSDMTFIINIEGENTITSDDVGISMGETSDKVQFQGTGKLTINAPKPISYEEGRGQKIIDLSSKTEVQEVTTNETEDSKLIISDEDDDKLSLNKDADNNNDHDDNDWLVRGLGILVLISIGVISFLVVKLIQKNKK